MITPLTTIASSATNSNLRRRLQPSGSRANPQITGKIRQSFISLLAADVGVTPVAICTITKPEPLARIPTLVGLNTHCAFGGSAAQENVKAPSEPFNGTIDSL